MEASHTSPNVSNLWQRCLINNRAFKTEVVVRDQDESGVEAYIGVLAEGLHAHLGRGGTLRGSGGSLGSLPEKWQRDLVRLALLR
jgi:hypothetical protein